MRNFRTAAVASATALTVLAGGTAIASAEDAQNETTSNDKAVVFVGKQEGDKDFGKVVSDGTEGLFGGKGSSQYFDDKDEPFYPTDAFGNKTNAEDVPQWARYWIDGSIVAAIGAVIGLIIAGLNFSFYNGWLQHPLSR